MGWAVGLTLAFVVVEATAGFLSHSLALIGDAGHNLADAGALGLSWYALWIARRPANARMTYGYHRVGILAAGANGLSLVVVALALGAESVLRFRYPEAPAGWTMAAIGALAVALNLTVGAWLHVGSHGDLNVRSAYLHMIGDAVSAAAVLGAGIVVACTGWAVADPIVSLGISALILFGSWRVLRETLHVLLEGAPEGLALNDVGHTISSVDGVLGVHDLHVWTVGPGVIAASLHVLAEDQPIRQGQQLVAAISQALRDRHHITHATIQLEVDASCGDAIFCEIKRASGFSHAGHTHAGHTH